MGSNILEPCVIIVLTWHILKSLTHLQESIELCTVYAKYEQVECAGESLHNYDHNSAAGSFGSLLSDWDPHAEGEA